VDCGRGEQEGNGAEAWGNAHGRHRGAPWVSGNPWVRFRVAAGLHQAGPRHGMWPRYFQYERADLVMGRVRLCIRA
jgi:hypothetical protein